MPKRLMNVPPNRTHDARGRVRRFCANVRYSLPDAAWPFTIHAIMHLDCFRVACSARGLGLESRLRCARLLAPGRTGACRQSEVRGRETPPPAARRAIERGLCLPVGDRWKGGT